MKSELTLAFNEITERFGLTAETVMEALASALVTAYRRSVNASTAQQVQAAINLETGGVQILAEKEVVDSVENPLTEVSLVEAQRTNPEAALGELIMAESTPADFGRVAAQTAKQVILQRLREAEREQQYSEFIEREGELVHGTVHSITSQTVTVGLGRAEAILPRNQQIPGEHFRVRDRIRVYVLEVRKSSRGPVIVVSRTHPNMLRRLLEMEVPEINQGMVEIKAIAREAGKRAKVAVVALRDGVDPVGACVGLRGVRIQSIVRDLNDEKIDVIEWNPTPSAFISKALSPARVSGVYLDEHLERGKTAMVVVPEDQLSLAIGRAGVNARLSARLTGWRIDIKSLPEAAAESLQLLLTNASYSDLKEKEEQVLPLIESILAKKAEERPVMPEEYKQLSSFVDRVQGEVHGRRQLERQRRAEVLAEVRADIPAKSYEITIEDLELTTRIASILDEAGYQSAGVLAEDMIIDADVVLGLSGLGPKSMEEIRERLDEVVSKLKEEEAAEAAIALAAAELEVSEAELEPAVAGAEVEPAAEMAEAEAPALEAQVEPAVEPEAVQPVELPAEPTPEVPVPLEEAIEEVVAEVFEEDRVVDEIEEEDDIFASKKDKKRKTGARVVEYDPELGEMVVKRRRKRGDRDDWSNYR